MIEVWVVSLICLAPPDQCFSIDPVVFPRTSYASEAECFNAGRKFAIELKLPRGKWGVFCMKGQEL